MTKKLFSRYTIYLMALCLGINAFLSWIMHITGIPLYLDSLGTVLAAALGGPLPGIAVGFVSNFINSISDPISRYYGILSVLIAVAATECSRLGWFKKAGKSLLFVLIAAVIGGGLGSLMTWVLYGFSFGEGITAPLALLLNGSLGIPEFWAQFTADFTIDIADKLITVAVACVILRTLPYKIAAKLPEGYIYDRTGKLTGERSAGGEPRKRLFRKHSLRTRITSIIIVITVAISIIAVIIGMSTYNEKLISRYRTYCDSAVSMMLYAIDGDKVGYFLSEGEDTPEYKATSSRFREIMDSIPDIEYMYVYQIKRDGVHVVFDMDTEELEGETVGTVLEFDPTFEPYLETLFEGGEIEPIQSNDRYGWLLTVYKPIRNSEGECVAYAAADIEMRQIMTDRYVYFIRMVSLLFAAIIVIAGYSMWYGERRIVEPISVMVERTRAFAVRKESGCVPETDGKLPPVLTGDELEVLFKSICRSEREIVGYISELNRKNGEISLMQRNIIFSLANMVENRDENTGEHIRRTALYVGIIGERLKADGNAEIDENYLKMLCDSAPLHDVGKIRVSDVILNKKGKLTPEEYEQMKKHSEYGYQILVSSLKGIEDGGYISMAAKMARYHHERWDGTGYPDGLKGEEIPLCARIMAVSDVFDAIVSKRSYKSARSAEEGFEEIRKASGTHFDPKVAEAFLAEADKVRGVMAE